MHGVTAWMRSPRHLTFDMSTDSIDRDVFQQRATNAFAQVRERSVQVATEINFGLRE
jgi:hypothetical protein